MGFQGKTDLHDTKAEHDHTHSPDQSENEIGEVIDYGNGIVGGKCRRGKTGQQSTAPAYAIKALLIFLLIGSFTVSFFWVSFLLKNFIDKSSFRC